MLAGVIAISGYSRASTLDFLKIRNLVETLLANKRMEYKVIKFN